MYEVFSDESCSSQNRYLVLGAIVVDFDDRDFFRERLNKVRSDNMTCGEFKWTKVSRAKLQVYKQIVDVFFDGALDGKISFHSLVIDQSKNDHKKHNQGDKELGFNKFIYQLLASRIGRLYGKNGNTINCYLDKRTTKHDPEELRKIINNGLGKWWGLDHAPFRRLHFLDSKNSLALQLNDVLMGALAAQINHLHKPKLRAEPKLWLANYVAERGCDSNVLADTPKEKCDFSIWHFVPKKGGN